MVTPADLRLFAPELANLSDATLNQWISFAGVIVKPTPWGSSYDFAIKALASHYAVSGSIQQAANAGGIIQSEKVADITRTYFKTGVGNADDYSSTAYGSLFAQLQKTLITSPSIV